MSLVVLALGTFMNYLIAVRSQNTENVIDLMYMNEKKSSSGNYYSSINPVKITPSLVTPEISTSENRGNYFQNEVIFALLSFVLLTIISAINIIRLCSCTTGLQSDFSKKKNSNKKHGIAVRTIVSISVGTDTCTFEESDQQSCSV